MQSSAQAGTTGADVMCGPGLICADQGKGSSSHISTAVSLIVNHNTHSQSAEISAPAVKNVRMHREGAAR